MTKPATNAGMNTLVAVAIAPCSTGDELSAEVAEVVRVIRESSLPNRTTSMFTEIEGDWDEVMQVVRDAPLCWRARASAPKSCSKPIFDPDLPTP